MIKSKEKCLAYTIILIYLHIKVAFLFFSCWYNNEIGEVDQMKKRILIVITALLLCSCSNNEIKHEMKHTQFEKNEKLDNVYEVTYYDFSYEDADE